jgi:hypothetical protein
MIVPSLLHIQRYSNLFKKLIVLGKYLTASLNLQAYVVNQVRMAALLKQEGLSWPWWIGSWIYNYLCNQWLSPLILWDQIPLRRGVLDTILCDKVCQWLTLVTGRWFFLGIPVSSTNKPIRHNIAEILLEVALNTINQTLTASVHKLMLQVKSWWQLCWSKKSMSITEKAV